LIVENQPKTHPGHTISMTKGINIEVNLWGFIRSPGRYIIPYKSTLLDLLTYSGGPLENSNLENVRLIRPGNDSLKTNDKIIKLNYEDLLWNEEVKHLKVTSPVLQTGDIVIVMQQKRTTLKEDLQFIIPIITGLLTIATFIITISK
jgi:protein involved in polysaccharide export with SLBB domain